MSETPDMELDTTVAPEVVTEVELVTEPQPEAEAAAESEVASEAAAAEPESEGHPEPETEPGAAAEPETEGATEPEAGAAVEPESEGHPEPETEPGAAAEQAAEVVAAPEPNPAAPPVSRPPVPSPAILAQRHGSPSARAFGRVDEDGIVYVRHGDGERAVGSYPGARPQDAIGYFVRKYDDLLASADLLLQRLNHTTVAAKEAAEAHAKLAEQVSGANVVGDLAALDEKVAAIAAVVESRRGEEAAERAAAKEAAKERRTAIVTAAEAISAQDPERIQWKASGARMRELLDEWKAEQRGGVRIDKDSEASLWHRFSAARNSFDKARRTYFAQLDSAQSEARVIKQKLVAEAESLAKSTDWAATAGAFKSLMSRWRDAGRASRPDDDALWTRFKTAQDSFFAAKDAVTAAEDEEYRANLAVKEKLVAEAEAILPVADLEKAKAALRSIQDRWESAGRVPRTDMDRIERALKRVEQTVREAEDKRWAASNPEAAARARSLVEQLESSVATLRKQLAAAQAKGDSGAVGKARDALQAREQWLEQARAGLAEFGG